MTWGYPHDLGKLHSRANLIDIHRHPPLGSHWWFSALNPDMVGRANVGQLSKSSPFSHQNVGISNFRALFSSSQLATRVFLCPPFCATLKFSNPRPSLPFVSDVTGVLTKRVNCTSTPKRVPLYRHLCWDGIRHSALAMSLDAAWRCCQKNTIPHIAVWNKFSIVWRCVKN